ncbi:MAG: glycosyltransferase family 39 protein [Alphaproteobacteria bacterium]|nr:glycosyltransferase family 39 protein [Alphaproteobacteria bacterium]
MSDSQNKIIKTLLWIAVIMFFVRLVSLGFTPMFDTTEARYAEIGRIMYETGNWLIPQFDYGIPFWGKPPLSFWATAASFHVFGVNDFATRLPHFLFMLGIAVMMYFFVKKYLGQMMAATTIAVLSTTTVFIYLAGGVMTDPAFAFCTTLAMIAFYNALFGGDRKRLWGYTFFIGMGIGLLAKGPLIFAIVGIPIFLFVLIKNKWSEVFRELPIVTGTLLMLAIALPWYILAERASPGFLEYFIIGEHYLRYITPEWAGDMYGAGRGGYIGQMVVFWLESLLPWLIWLAVMSFSRRFRGTLFSREFIKNDFLFYMILNVAVTLLFFSLSKNLVMNYVATIFAPTAAIIGWLVYKNDDDMPKLPKFKLFTGLNVAIFVVIIAVGALYPKYSADMGRSDRFLVKTYIAQRSGDDVPLIYFMRGRNYSGRFYSGGKVIMISDFDKIRSAAFEHGEVFIIIRRNLNIEDYDFKDMKKTVVTVGKKTSLIKITAVTNSPT